MARSQAQQIKKIDSLIEDASRALDAGDEFVAERAAAEALSLAHALVDYERMVRALEPLRRSRAGKRDRAVQSGRVTIVDDALPIADGLQPGCYLIQPPRVGVDGRALREQADERGVPVLVVVREPTTQNGKWPVVAVGSVTIRAKVEPPAKPTRRKTTKKKSKTSRTSKKKPTRAKSGATDAPPEPEWFITATGALGQAATSELPPAAAARVDALVERINTIPDDEGLYDQLAQACADAAREAAGAA